MISSAIFRTSPSFFLEIHSPLRFFLKDNPKIDAATMSTSQLNPAQHVERIREIIMGRDLTQVRGRLERIENGLDTTSPASSSSEIQNLQNSFEELQAECLRLRNELQQEKNMRKQQLGEIDQHMQQLVQDAPIGTPSTDSDDIASEMAARIDARFREMMSHLQTELLQWKGQLDRDVQALREVKMDRKDVMQRFARIVSAAMEDEDEANPKNGYLL